jgi:hypothetical protein
MHIRTLIVTVHHFSPSLLVRKRGTEAVGAVGKGLVDGIMQWKLNAVSRILPSINQCTCTKLPQIAASPVLPLLVSGWGWV